jgi:hypothetical protein
MIEFDGLLFNMGNTEDEGLPFKLSLKTEIWKYVNEVYEDFKKSVYKKAYYTFVIEEELCEFSIKFYEETEFEEIKGIPLSFIFDRGYPGIYFGCKDVCYQNEKPILETRAALEALSSIRCNEENLPLVIDKKLY